MNHTPDRNVTVFTEALRLPATWKSLYLFGFLYALAPLLALFTLYLVLVNLPFGIVTAWAARAIIGKHP
jgi:hypothetical protein